jgi:plastocyanin
MRVLKRRVRFYRVAIAAALGLLLGSLVLIGPAPTAAADVSVAISNFAFVPPAVTIPAGTTVVWTNNDSVSHTVTSDTGIWDSGSLEKSGSFRYTFTTPGTFAYHCIPHPYMTASITVTAAGGASGTSAAPSAASGAFADPAFQQLWAKTDANPAGRSYVWGPGPFTGGLMEDYAEAPGGKRLVQYFDKARMELTTPGGPVTAGLLSVELITGRPQNGNGTFVARQPAKVTVAGDPDNPFPTYADLAKVQAPEQNNTASGAPVAKLANPDGTFGTYAPATSDTLAKTAGYDDATKHNIPKAFFDFRNSPNLGGVQAIGLAITEPVWANVKVGGKTVPVLVQAFERRVLTYTPDNPILFRVEYGNIGRAYYAWRYGS